MCGIVGIMGKQLTYKSKSIFNTMFVLDSLRGIHNTGVLAVSDYNGDLSTEVEKVSGDVYRLLDSKRYDDITANRVLLGHNRHATIGDHGYKNAHPFTVNKIIGVHNGTIKNKHSLEGGSFSNVDSEAAFKHIERNGVQNFVDTVDGSYALVWFDGTHMNFLRNPERPLFLASTKKGEVCWASEYWMITTSVIRNGEELEEQPTELPANTLLRIDVNTLERTETTVKPAVKIVTYIGNPKWVKKKEEVSSSMEKSLTGYVHKVDKGIATIYCYETREYLIYRSAQHNELKEGDSVLFDIWDSKKQRYIINLEKMEYNYASNDWM